MVERHHPQYQPIDLSHPVHEHMPVYPGDEPVCIRCKTSVVTDGYALSSVCFSVHAGTHVDAPAHMIQNGEGIGSIPLSRFFGRACLLDCRTCKGTITAGILQTEMKRISGADILLLRTGWEVHWGTADYFEGYPVLNSEAASLLAGFGLCAVGIDAPSFDAAQSADFPVHRILLGAEKILIENLTGLGKLPEQGFLMSAFPLAFGKNVDGSPVRAVAWIEPNEKETP